MTLVKKLNKISSFEPHYLVVLLHASASLLRHINIVYDAYD